MGRIENLQSQMEDLQNQQQLQTLLESKRFRKRRGKLTDISFEFLTSTNRKRLAKRLVGECGLPTRIY